MVQFSLIFLGHGCLEGLIHLRAHFTYTGIRAAPSYRGCWPSCENQFSFEPGPSRSCAAAVFRLFALARQNMWLSVKSSGFVGILRNNGQGISCPTYLYPNLTSGFRLNCVRIELYFYFIDTLVAKP